MIVELPDKSDIKSEAISQAKYALENLKVEVLVSQHLKKYFDSKYGPNWHCIVGKNFHSYISYESKHFLYFYEGPVAILLYKL